MKSFHSMEREYHSCGMEGGVFEGGGVEVKRNNQDDPFPKKKIILIKKGATPVDNFLKQIKSGFPGFIKSKK